MVVSTLPSHQLPPPASCGKSRGTPASFPLCTSARVEAAWASPTTWPPVKEPVSPRQAHFPPPILRTESGPPTGLLSGYPFATGAWGPKGRNPSFAQDDGEVHTPYCLFCICSSPGPCYVLVLYCYHIRFKAGELDHQLIGLNQHTVLQRGE